MSSKVTRVNRSSLISAQTYYYIGVIVVAVVDSVEAFEVMEMMMMTRTKERIGIRRHGLQIKTDTCSSINVYEHYFTKDITSRMKHCEYGHIFYSYLFL